MDAAWRKENTWATSLAKQRDARILGAQPPDTAGTFNAFFVWTMRQLSAVAAPGVSVEALVQRKQDKMIDTLICGRRGETSFERRDGLRCQMKINLRQQQKTKSLELLSYALQLRPPSDCPQASPQLLRWEYSSEPKSGVDALKEPQSHLHPGHKDLRLPSPVLSPKELIALFLGLERWW